MIKGEVKSVSIDQNGNLKVETEYTLTDGSKKVGHTRYSSTTFSTDKVLRDVTQHCETLMYKVYNLKQNQILKDTKVDDINYECTSCEITIPAVYDKDGNIIKGEEKRIIDDQ